MLIKLTQTDDVVGSTSARTWHKAAPREASSAAPCEISAFWHSELDMGLAISSLFGSLFGQKAVRILMGEWLHLSKDSDSGAVQLFSLVAFVA